MADEIKLKAPTVEQQVVVNIQGEEKLRSFADTLDKMSKGRNLQKYWKEQEALIKDVVEAYKKFGRVANEDTASELLKTANALKAMSNSDISSLSPELNNISSALQKAEGVAGHLVDAFSINAFKDAFSAFEVLQAYGVDIQKLFSHFKINTDVDKLVSDLENANRTINELTLRTRELQDKLDDSESGNGIRAVREECENLRWEIENIRNEAANTFSAFLTSNNINADSYQYEEFFERIREGSLTAQEAIAEFKRDYSYLLDNGASFDISQLQDFSRRLDDVSVKITEISNKLDDISSNGVKVSEGNTSGNLEELSNVINEIENANVGANTSNIYEALSKILITIREIGQADTDNIYHLYATIRNLAQLNDLKINKASLDNLADCLERICKIDNTSSLSNLSLVDFKKFNDLHISKASLNNLAEYLPQIANINTEKLIELTKIDFSNLNDFKIDKTALDNLKQFADSLREVFRGNDVESVKGASIAKNDFASANEGVQSSVDESNAKLESEAELFDRIAKSARNAAEAKNEFANANKNVSGSTTDKSNISSVNSTVEVSQNDEVTASIRKKKEELASYELQLEETRYEIEKLAKSENTAYGFSREYSDKQVESIRNTVTDSIFAKPDNGGRKGSNKWFAQGNLTDISASALKSYQMWQEELQKVGYTLSKIRDIGSGLEADIIPIDGKAITNAEEFRKALDSITTAPSENVELLNKQIAELEAKISSLKSEISSLESSKNSPMKDVFQGDKIDQATTSAKELDKTLEQVNIPTDSFDEVLSKLDRTKSELGEIVKITKQSVSDSEGKFHDSYTLKDNRGSTEIYGLSSNTEKGQLLRSNIVGYDAKAEAQEAKRLVEENIRLNKAYYDSKKQEEAEYQRLRAKYLAEGKAQEEKYYADLKKSRESTLKSYQDQINSFDKQIPKKPIDGQRSDKFEGLVQNYKNAIEEARKYLDTLGDSPVTKEVKDEWERLIDVIKKAKEEMDAVPNAARGSDADARMKEIDKLTKYLDKNTRISKEAREQLEEYLALLKSGDPSVNVKELHTAWTKVAVAEREAGREGKSFLDIFKNKVVYNYAAQLAGYYLSFMDMIRYARNAVSAVQELDTALVDLKKTTTMSASELERFYYDSNDVAKQMGVTTASIIEQASAWSRLGFSTKEQATQMAELSSQFASISPGMSTDDAQEGLVSIMKAWDISTDQVEREVMDNINILGNKFAETNQDIVEGMKRSAATFAALGQTWTDSFAIFTGAQEVIQNAETVGKSISAYLYSNIMKIKVAISVKIQRWTRPRKDYNICYNF